ncbi:MAG: hypothetical protein N3D85_05795 [Candidatus Bathyarchaeota archaeon]|nr:hypothetical protein [Candidatus Bathyarchaeota archaeon]
MGTEIRTFASLKDLTEYLVDQLTQYKGLFEDYSQWLGSLLRSCEEEHKNDEWFQKSAALQKTLKAPTKKGPEAKGTGKKVDQKGNAATSVWVQSGNVLLCSTEQGQVEIMFEAIEKINEKIQELEKFKVALQQLERLGLGKTVSYVVYIEEDIPKKIVLRAKDNSDDVFKFATELSVPAILSDINS